MDTLLKSLNHDNHGLAVEIAGLSEQIRGFGHVKRANINKTKEREAALLNAIHASDVSPEIA